MFENNELAIIIWVLILAGVLLILKSTRRSFLDILKSLFQVLFLKLYFITLSYIFLIVFLLYKASLWNLSLLKSTIIWIIFNGIVMIFKLQINGKFKNNFIDILNENLSYSIIVEFIIGLSLFSFISEFLLIPLYFFLGLLLAYSEINKNTISNKIKKLVTIFSLILVVYKIFDLAVNYKNYFKPSLISELLLAPILSITFVPFLWMLFIYMNYENVFMSLKIILPPKFLKCAEWNALIYFRTNVIGLKRWLHQMHLMSGIDEFKIKESVKKIMKLQALEKKPPKIDDSVGWSPYLANKYLEKVGLIAGFYFNYSGDEYWHASANTTIGPHILKNNILYYLNGREDVVTSLKLVLNIDDVNSSNIAFAEYLKYVTTLYEKVFNNSLPEKLATAFVLNKDLSSKIGKFEITIQRTIWNVRNGCYKVNFEIKHHTHID